MSRLTDNPIDFKAMIMMVEAWENTLVDIAHAPGQQPPHRKKMMYAKEACLMILRAFRTNDLDEVHAATNGTLNAIALVVMLTIQDKDRKAALASMVADVENCVAKLEAVNKGMALLSMMKNMIKKREDT